VCGRLPPASSYSIDYGWPRFRIIAEISHSKPNVAVRIAFFISKSGIKPREAIVVTTTNAAVKLPHRATHELRRFVSVFVYLYIIIGAITVFKTAVLHTQGIEYAFWGISAIKAAVLAKFMLLGHAMKIGEGDTTSPLIWPTLHRALGFLVLLVILTIIEEIVVGLLHHRPAIASLGELFGTGLQETLAGYLIMLLVLVPYFAFRVLGEALGEGRLVRMFFVAREPGYGSYDDQAMTK
jgi:hypothetical protein